MAIRVKSGDGTFDTLDAGFYATDDETYYVTPMGRVWIVASADDLGTGDDPKEILPADLPAADTLRSVEDLLTPDECIGHCERIEAVSGERLIEP